jgi:predicted transcriptional regulator of viral defense system
MRMRYLRNYIHESLADGKYFFTKDEALSALSISSEQFRFQAYRLMGKSAISSLTRDSFMIIPAEYQHLGSTPPHWVIDPLMQHLHQHYYIGLLTAASMHGASHQQPMSFQVITDNARRSIKLSRSVMEFHMFKGCTLASTEQISSPAGYARISSREQTMLDIVRFYQSCGFLSNVATVIKDLASSYNKTTFATVVRNEKNNSVLQRLGFICSYAGFQKLADVISGELSNRKTQFILLRPDVRSREGVRDKNFKLIINDTIEIEE